MNSTISPAKSKCFRWGGRFCFTGTTLTSSSAYTYYPTGNVATDTENTGKVTTYLYDDLGRPTTALENKQNFMDYLNSI